MLKAKRDGLPYSPESDQKDDSKVLREKRQACEFQGRLNYYNTSLQYLMSNCSSPTNVIFNCE